MNGGSRAYVVKWTPVITDQLLNKLKNLLYLLHMGGRRIYIYSLANESLELTIVHNYVFCAKCWNRATIRGTCHNRRWPTRKFRSRLIEKADPSRFDRGEIFNGDSRGQVNIRCSDQPTDLTSRERPTIHCCAAHNRKELSPGPVGQHGCKVSLGREEPSYPLS